MYSSDERDAILGLWRESGQPVHRFARESGLASAESIRRRVSYDEEGDQRYDWNDNPIWSQDPFDSARAHRMRLTKGERLAAARPWSFRRHMRRRPSWRIYL